MLKMACVSHVWHVGLCQVHILNENIVLNSFLYYLGDSSHDADEHKMDVNKQNTPHASELDNQEDLVKQLQEQLRITLMKH